MTSWESLSFPCTFARIPFSCFAVKVRLKFPMEMLCPSGILFFLGDGGTTPISFSEPDVLQYFFLFFLGYGARLWEDVAWSL